jgi:hypothetical protein
MVVSWLLTSTLIGCEAPPSAPLEPAAIQALPDPIQRVRALEEAVYGGGWDLARLEQACASFTDPALTEACGRYLGRPHLFRGAALDRTGDAEGASACPSDCEAAPSLVDCVVERALAGDQEGCGCLPQALARDECWFRVAQGRGLDGGLEACLAAGSSKGPCLHHHAELFAGHCPALRGELDGWRALAGRVEALEGAVAHWDAFEREQLIDVAWAGAMRCAFQRPQGFDPSLWEALPEAAHPHLRAALAWHVVAASRAEPADLTRWRGAYEAYAREGRAPDHGQQPLEIPAGPGESWAHDSAAWALARPGGGSDCGLPRRYFAMGKRLSSPEPSLDADLCLLEAAARVFPAPGPVMAQAAGASWPELRCASEALRSWRAQWD